MAIYALGDLEPTIHPDAYVHPDAVVIGSVTLGAGTSVWPSAVVRADFGFVTVGENTSIQDGAVIHCTAELPTRIGSHVTIGHLAHLEGCIVEDWALIGVGSKVLHRAVVRSEALVGAGAVVTNDTEVPSLAMALGVPAVIKENRVQPDHLRSTSAGYVKNAQRYRSSLRRLD